MTGNVWEWMSDCDKTNCGARGGGSVSGPQYVIATFRAEFKLDSRGYDMVGFRLARSLP